MSFHRSGTIFIPCMVVRPKQLVAAEHLGNDVCPVGNKCGGFRHVFRTIHAGHKAHPRICHACIQAVRGPFLDELTSKMHAFLVIAFSLSFFPILAKAPFSVASSASFRSVLVALNASWFLILITTVSVSTSARHSSRAPVHGTNLRRALKGIMTKVFGNTFAGTKSAV